jgi:hypothetical protein
MSIRLPLKPARPAVHIPLVEPLQLAEFFTAILLSRPARLATILGWSIDPPIEPVAKPAFHSNLGYLLLPNYTA